MNLPVLETREYDDIFSESPDRSFTLPARYYNDPEIYELEKEAIFYTVGETHNPIVKEPKPIAYYMVNITRIIFLQD